MRKILLIINNKRFIDDIERNMFIEDYVDFTIDCQDIDNALHIIGQENAFTEIIVAPAYLKSIQWNSLGVLVRSFAYDKQDIITSDDVGIESYGIATRASQLLSLIQKNSPIVITQKKKTINENNKNINNSTNTMLMQHENTDQIKYTDTTSVNAIQTDITQVQTPSKPIEQLQYYDYITFDSNRQYTEEEIEQINSYNKKVEAWNNYVYEQYLLKAAQPTNNTEQAHFNQEQSVQNVQAKTNISVQNMKNNEMQNSSIVSNLRTNIATEKEISIHEIDKNIKDTLYPAAKKARCVTVYSAKGGVGKTTISCELATFLALTSKGRENYKVCIADFNIDFGDVLNTLSYNTKGATMTTWAFDIKERLDNGEKENEINYTKEQIYNWLQRNDRDGLYALLAPITNADSMDISEKEIGVMLRNLIENGDFDFVICDTGNNTRDSSFISLEMADDILLVLTQDVNTANCNNSFLATAERIDFDMSKFKLVINKIRPTRQVGIAPEELEEVFINSKTGKPYHFECYANIKDNDAVASSSNLGEPLVYNTSHEFTKSIGSIVAKLCNKPNVLRVEKQSFWDKIFKKKG